MTSYYGDGDITLARRIAEERAGRRMDGESDEEREERVQSRMPRANPVPIAGTTESARTARTERKQRQGVKA